MRGFRKITQAIFSILFFAVMLVAIFPDLVYAGVGDWLTENIINGAIAVLLALVAAIWGAVWRHRAKEFTDILKRYWEAKKRDSAGGEQVTAEEWKQLAEELVEFVLAMFPSYFGTRIKSQAQLTRGER